MLEAPKRGVGQPLVWPYSSLTGRALEAPKWALERSVPKIGEGHISAHHVDKSGKLIKADMPKKSAESARFTPARTAD